MPAKLPAIEPKWTSEFEDYLRKEKKIQDEDTKNLQEPLQKAPRRQGAKREVCKKTPLTLLHGYVCSSGIM